MPVEPLPFAILLGLIQGLTEFLPISSSGHLAAAQLLFPAMAYPGVTLEVATHLGTMVAVLIYYRPLVRALVVGGERDVLLGLSRERWIFLLVVGSVPTAMIGFLAREAVRAAFDSIEAIALGLVLSGAVLMLSRLRPASGQRFDWWRALLIGTVQGVAIFPGVSRSGLTITAALLTGVSERRAVTYSFFLAVPAILGASMLDLVQVLGAAQPPALLFDRLLLATLVAGFVGYFCIGLVHRATETGWWHRFAWYCWLAALVLIVAAR